MRVPEQYIYEQIHVDGLDRQGTDPFTSAREHIIATDPVYQAVLEELKGILTKIYDHWDRMHFSLKQNGDSTSKQLDRQTRAASSLASDTIQSILKKLPQAERNHWKDVTNELTSRATMMIQCLTLAFLTESILRRLLVDNGYNENSTLPPYIQSRLYKTPNKDKEGIDRIAATTDQEKQLGHFKSKSIRRVDSILDYLLFSELLSFNDKEPGGLSLRKTAPEPAEKTGRIIQLRNIVMHCCTFTDYEEEEFLNLYPTLHKLITEFASTRLEDSAN